VAKLNTAIFSLYNAGHAFPCTVPGIAVVFTSYMPNAHAREHLPLKRQNF